MNKKIIEAFLSPYKEESRFLKSFELVESKGMATFNVNSDFYCINKTPVHHFTAVELQVCLNQMLYIYFAHLGLFDNYLNLPRSKTFINTLNENNFITEQITHYKKDIDSSQMIYGEIEIIKTKKIDRIHFIECQFKFGEGCFGSVKVILKE